MRYHAALSKSKQFAEKCSYLKALMMIDFFLLCIAYFDLKVQAGMD